MVTNGGRRASRFQSGSAAAAAAMVAAADAALDPAPPRPESPESPESPEDSDPETSSVWQRVDSSFCGSLAARSEASADAKTRSVSPLSHSHGRSGSALDHEPGGRRWEWIRQWRQEEASTHVSQSIAVHSFSLHDWNRQPRERTRVRRYSCIHALKQVHAKEIVKG